MISSLTLVSNCLETSIFCSYNIPLVADIHFAPSVALRVAECFDKIRVNPGNFGNISILLAFSLIFMRIHLKSSHIGAIASADRRAQFEELEYTEDDYQKELEHIEKVNKLSTHFYASYFLESSTSLDVVVVHCISLCQSRQHCLNQSFAGNEL